VSKDLYEKLEQQIRDLKTQGLFKHERVIASPQSANVATEAGDVINLCANNYLGLANDPVLVYSAIEGLKTYGYGVASVRFICGTQTIHKQLETALSRFLGMEDTILYSSCFDANTGLFETLLDDQDAVISDALNHASIIDGVRLCKAKRYRYANNNMLELEARLQESQDARTRLIVTDGVFSMDGVIADLHRVCDLAEQYDALVMVDDSHAVGVLGEYGSGTHEHCGVRGRVDIITGTLGKALGGASGGYTAAKKPVIEWLRQRSRPYLFSNSLAPSIVSASLQVLSLLQDKGATLRHQLAENAHYFRQEMQANGFTLTGADHPIVPVMIGDAALAARFSARLLALGIYAVAFSFPVVPKGKARIRTQMSAAHNREHLDKAIAAFVTIGRELEVIS